MLLLGLIEIVVVINAANLVWTRLKTGTAKALEHNWITTIILIVSFVVIIKMEQDFLQTALVEGQYSVPVSTVVQLDTKRVTVDGKADIEIDKTFNVDGNPEYLGYVTDIYVEDRSITTDHFWHEFSFRYDTDMEMKTGSFSIEDSEDTYYIDVISEEINHNSLEITKEDVWNSQSIREKSIVIIVILANIISILYAAQTEIAAQIAKRKGIDE